MFGLLNINKRQGATSRDAVNQVQRLVRPHKVGHAGTLDPLATGVLVVCIGPATRLVPYVQQMPKTYRGTFLLGCRSDTEDVEGEVEQLTSAPEITAEDIVNVLPQFCGEILQRPPAYSALKVKGKRAHELARAGATLKLEPRPVQIYRLEMLDFDYPKMALEIECGSGTYVRSLGRDIGETLGSAAIMSALTRTAIGPFTLENAIDANALDKQTVQEQLLPPSTATSQLPEVRLSPTQQTALSHGREIDHPIPTPIPTPAPTHVPEFAGVAAETGNLIAILRPTSHPNRLKPIRVFNP